MNNVVGVTPADTKESGRRAAKRIRWGFVLLAGLTVLLIPVPEGVTVQSWRLLAIFVATITGSIVGPAPGGAIVLAVYQPWPRRE
jgi:di/tricarboxylate transporter